MNKQLLLAGVALGLLVGGCATSSQDQRRAQEHQYNSDVAAASGRYGVAEDEQRKAADAHHKAVKKAIDEGKPIPPQPTTGDPRPAPEASP